MTKIYAVALDSKSEDAEQRLREHYDKMFKHTDELFLIVGKENDLAYDVARIVGLKEKTPTVAGVVFRLSGSYSGFTDPALWEWLKDVTAEA